MLVISVKSTSELIKMFVYSDIFKILGNFYLFTLLGYLSPTNFFNNNQ